MGRQSGELVLQAGGLSATRNAGPAFAGDVGKGFEQEYLQHYVSRELQYWSVLALDPAGGLRGCRSRLGGIQ